MIRFNRDSMSARLLYDEDYYETMAAGNYAYFCRNRGAALLPNRLRDLARVKLEPGMTVLDVGCGRGELCTYCALHGVNTIGIDWSDTPIAIGNKCIEDFHILDRAAGYISLICADGCRLPFASNTFHRVMSWAFLEHLEAWEAEVFIEETKRVLRPDGALVIGTHPNELPIRLAHGLLRPIANQLLHTKLPNYRERMAYEREEGGHLHLWSPFSLRRLLASAHMACYAGTFSEEYGNYPSLPRCLRRMASRARWLSPFFANGVWAIAAESQSVLRKFVAQEDRFIPRDLSRMSDAEVLATTSTDHDQFE